MRIVAGVAVSLALAAGGAAAAGPPQIAFTAGDSFDNGDVVLLSADGLSLTNLTPGKASAYDDDRSPSWSPDGSRLAFVSHRDGPSNQEIYVMNADGSAPKRLTTDSGADRVFNVDPAWSPDGTTIAWRRASSNQDDIWLMRPDGTSKRRFTSDAGQKTGPRWSPDSKRLLWERRNGASANGIYVGQAATGITENLSPAATFDSSATWSPDGTRLAFLSGETVWVMDADGRNRRQVGVTRGSSPAWAPDGASIAFVGVRAYPEYGTRYGPAYRFDVYTVGVDTQLERRLTGPADDDYSVEPGGTSPAFWPDGSRIFFSSLRAGDNGNTIWVMNADGTCESRFSPGGPRLIPPPVWRPGTPTGLPAIQCADLKVSVEPSTDATGLKTDVEYRISVENDGDLTATGARVTVTADSPAELATSPASPRTCTAGRVVRCSLPPLAPRASDTVVVLARSSSPGSIRLRVTVSAAERDSDRSSNEALSETPVLPCSIVGTTGNDAIYATEKRDTICARTGWDHVYGRQGNDDIDAGNGNDTVEGGKGRDRILGQGGRDVILVRDGERDTVDCGTEADLVVADAEDIVARNCEEVIRP